MSPYDTQHRSALHTPPDTEAHPHDRLEPCYLSDTALGVARDEGFERERVDGVQEEDGDVGKVGHGGEGVAASSFVLRRRLYLSITTRRRRCFLVPFPIARIWGADFWNDRHARLFHLVTLSVTFSSTGRIAGRPDEGKLDEDHEAARPSATRSRSSPCRPIHPSYEHTSSQWSKDGQ